jgi:hypothetical protein
LCESFSVKSGGERPSLDFVNALAARPLHAVPVWRQRPLCLSGDLALALGLLIRCEPVPGRVPVLQIHHGGVINMSKLLSILIASVFALSTGAVFAASHMKAAPGEKKEEMKKEEKKEDKGEMKKEKKEKKAKKAEKKEDKK